MSKTTKLIDGRYIGLSEGRKVFVGRTEAGTVALGFRSSDGDVTKFSLSADAAGALTELLTNPISGTYTDMPIFLCEDKTGGIRYWTAIVKNNGIASVDVSEPSP